MADERVKSSRTVRGGNRGPAAIRKQLASRLRHRLWQAEFIGWPALAESFRRELRAMGEEP